MSSYIHLLLFILMFHIVTFVLGIVNIYQLHIEVETYICSSCELLQHMGAPLSQYTSVFVQGSKSLVSSYKLINAK